MTWEVLCKCSGKYIDIYFNLKITFCVVHLLALQALFLLRLRLPLSRKLLWEFRLLGLLLLPSL